MAIRQFIYALVAVLLAAGTSAQPLFQDSFEERAIFDTMAVSGNVVLPPELAIDPASLVVINGVQSSGVAVDASGNFSVITGNGPQLALVVDDAGNTLLAGWFEAGNATLSARSTAEVLLYFQLGSSFSDPNLYPHIIRLIPNSPAALDAVEAAIVSALSTSPTALDSGDPGVSQALADARDAILDAASPAANKDVLVQSGRQSGVTVLNRFQSVQIQNDLRRPAFAYLDRVSCNIGGSSVAAGTGSCPALSDQFDVSAITGLQTLPQAIADAGRVLIGLDDELPIAYTPTITDRQYLPLETDVDSVNYRVVVVGAGLQPGIFDELNAAQQAQATSINRTFIVRDLVLPVIVNVLLPGESNRINGFIGSEAGTSFVQDLVGLIANPNFEGALQQGDFSGAARIGIETVLGSGAARQQMIEFLYQALHVRNLEANDLQGYLDRAATLLRVLGIVDAALAGIDVTVAGAAFGNANAADRWDIVVTPAPVFLTAQQSRATCTQNASFIAGVNADTEGLSLRYRYSIPPDTGQLIAADGSGQSSFQELVTDSTMIEFSPFATAGSDAVTISVAVEGFDQRRSGPLGEASGEAQVERPQVELTPRVSSVQPGASIDLTGAVQDSLNNLEGCTDGVDPRFIWSSTTSAGNIDVIQGLLLDRETVTYTGDVGQQGTDTVTVEVYLSNILIGTDTAEVRVEQDPTIVFGTYTVDTEPLEGGGFCANATVIVPNIPGATGYQLNAYNGYDRFFWGTRITGTAPPFDTGFGVPLTQEDRRLGLSGRCGDLETSLSWFEERFGSGWIWQINVTR